MIPNLSLPSETSSDDKDGDSQSQKDISVFVQIELLQRRDVFVSISYKEDESG